MIIFPNNRFPPENQLWANRVESEINRLDKKSSSTQPQQQIIHISGSGVDASLPTAVRYTPSFTGTGLTFTGTGTSHPAYDSWYVKHGQIVHFGVKIDCTTVTNFGTGQLKTQLPFMPLLGYNHFSGWVWADPTVSPDVSPHIILNVDTTGITDIADMHFLVAAPAQPKPVIENQLIQGAMGYNLTTISKIYVSGSYIAAA
jgi:hypothetical protein